VRIIAIIVVGGFNKICNGHRKGWLTVWSSLRVSRIIRAMVLKMLNLLYYLSNHQAYRSKSIDFNSAADSCFSLDLFMILCCFISYISVSELKGQHSVQV